MGVAHASRCLVCDRRAASGGRVQSTAHATPGRAAERPHRDSFAHASPADSHGGSPPAPRLPAGLPSPPRPPTRQHGPQPAGSVLGLAANSLAIVNYVGSFTTRALTGDPEKWQGMEAQHMAFQKRMRDYSLSVGTSVALAGLAAISAPLAAAAMACLTCGTYPAAPSFEVRCSHPTGNHGGSISSSGAVARARASPVSWQRRRAS